MYLSLSGFSLGTLLVHFSLSIPLSLIVFITLFVVLASFVKTFSLESSHSLTRTSVKAVSLGFFVLVGASYALIEIDDHKAAQISVNQTGEESSIRGFICNIPRVTQYGQQAHLCSDRGRLQINVPIHTLDLSKGMCWRGSARLKAPRSSYNTHVKSYERYLFSERIIGSASMRSVEPSRCSNYELIASALTRWRWAIHEHLREAWVDLPHRGVIEALVLGHKALITPQENELLALSGTAHLMAISGLHVGLICWAIYSLLRKLRKEKYALFVVGIAGFAYIALVGFSPSAQRAYVMVMCALLVLTGRVPVNAWAAYCLALALVLLLDPLAPLNSGFWFSFAAVFVLLVIYHFNDWLRESGLVTNLLVIQIVLTLSLAATQAHFQVEVSSFSVLANLVAIPWVSCVVLPGSLVAALLSALPWLGEISIALFEVLSVVIDVMFEFLALAELFPLLVPSTEPAAAAVFFALVVSATLQGVNRFLFVSVLVFLSFSLLLAKPLDDDRAAPAARFTVHDVGQGLAITVHEGARAWVYDTGPSYERFSAAKNILLPYIRGDDVHGVIISHGDADHSGRAAWFVEQVQPQVTLLGEPDRSRLPLAQSFRGESGTLTAESRRRCIEGQSLSSSSSLEAHVLWPISGVAPGSNSNSRSCVVRFTIAGIRFLVMGDVEGKVEHAFVRHYLSKDKRARRDVTDAGDTQVPISSLKADVLIAGHHGAKAATTTALLKHVRPQHIVFSSGFANRFGHPSERVLKRVSRFDVDVWRTATDGGLTFVVTGDGMLNVYSARQQQLPYWIGA